MSFPQILEKFKAISIGQARIYEHKVVITRLFEHLLAIPEVVRSTDLMAFLLKKIAQDLANHTVVLDNQDSRLRRSPLRTTTDHIANRLDPHYRMTSGQCE